MSDILCLQGERTRLAGLEFELPVVNRKNEPVDFDVIHKMTDAVHPTIFFP